MASGGNHRALDIVEILEAIFARLPTKEIFRMQRVSSLWRSITLWSPTLGQRLFYRALPVTKTWIFRAEPDEDAIRKNPHHLPIFFYRTYVAKIVDGPAVGDYGIAHEYDRIPVVALNEFLLRQPTLKELNQMSTEGPFMHDTNCLADRVEIGEGMRLLDFADIYAHDSRYGMFLTNPPCRSLTISLFLSEERSGEYIQLHEDGGIRFFHVCQAIREEISIGGPPEYCHLALDGVLCPRVWDEELVRKQVETEGVTEGKQVMWDNNFVWSDEE